MKKNIDEKKQMRRLTLNRETIQILDNPSLLELARVHGQSGSQCQCTTTVGEANTVGCEPTLWSC